MVPNTWFSDRTRAYLPIVPPAYVDGNASTRLVAATHVSFAM